MLHRRGVSRARLTRSSPADFVPRSDPGATPDELGAIRPIRPSWDHGNGPIASRSASGMLGGRKVSGARADIPHRNTRIAIWQEPRSNGRLERRPEREQERRLEVWHESGRVPGTTALR